LNAMPDLLSNLQIADVDFDDFSWTVERLRKWWRGFRFIVKEIRSPAPVSLSRALHYWSKGFSKQAGLVYQLSPDCCEDYIPDFNQYVRGPAINGFYDHVLNNKLLLQPLLFWARFPCPELLGSSRTPGTILNAAGRKVDLVSHLQQLLESHPKLAIKPVKGHKGSGFLALSLDGTKPRVNGRPSNWDEFRQALSCYGAFIITSYIRQAEYASTLNPDTSNTIRLLTMWDDDAGQPFIGAASQRIGNRRSFPTDNWRAGRGGYSAEIDLETGVLGKGATLSDDRHITFAEFHAETGAAIEGIQVPNWDRLVEAILAAARRLSFAAQIGWDIIVTDEGNCAIEINGCPGLNLHQVHRPLLKDERIRRFYQNRGLVKAQR